MHAKLKSEPDFTICMKAATSYEINIYMALGQSFQRTKKYKSMTKNFAFPNARRNL